MTDTTPFRLLGQLSKSAANAGVYRNLWSALRRYAKSSRNYGNLHDRFHRRGLYDGAEKLDPNSSWVQELRKELWDAAVNKTNAREAVEAGVGPAARDVASKALRYGTPAAGGFALGNLVGKDPSNQTT